VYVKSGAQIALHTWAVVLHHMIGKGPHSLYLGRFSAGMVPRYGIHPCSLDPVPSRFGRFKLFADVAPIRAQEGVKSVECLGFISDQAYPNSHLRVGPNFNPDQIISDGSGRAADS
jgi:hypothetical protein